MYTFTVILFILVSFLMIITILLQATKGGLASSFGGAGNVGGVLGSRGAASFLQKATITLGILYALLCIGINKIGDDGSNAPRSITQEKLREETQQAAPLTPSQEIFMPSDTSKESGQEQPSADTTTAGEKK